MVKSADFNELVKLPNGFTIAQLRKAIEYIEREAGELVDLYLEQANVFSALVGILGTRALDQVSGYEKHKNLHTAQQQFPDLVRRGSGSKPKAVDCLESKASKRPWAIQSHYNHAGWYIVWRYLVDTTESFEGTKPVLIWRVDMVFLDSDDWTFEGSKAAQGTGGRTHTFGIKKAAKRLQGCAVYQRSDVVLRGGKPVPKNGD